MRKNKRGEISVGLILTIVIALLVGLVLFQPIASNVDKGTRENSGSVTAANAQYTGILNTKVELIGQELVSVTSVTNKTSDGEVVAPANYTIAECIRPSDGLKGICYTALSNANPLPATGPVNITYVYYPDGYIDDSGGRSIFGLIVIFAAIAIVVVVLYPSMKDKFGTD